MTTLFEYYGTGYNKQETLFGTEYELESISSYTRLAGTLDNNIVIELDNSLRNNGYEFKTQAISLTKSLEIFNILFKLLEFKKRKQAFSDRTSIHVHLNVADLTLEQAKEFVLLYALLEPVFFNFVAKDRHNNIFCVPLNFTTLPNKYCQEFKTMVNYWHKYTAFNILPVKELGTFEFRHMEATDDFDKYKNWLSAIASLKDFVKNKTFTILTYLKEGRSIKNLALEVIPTICKDLTDELFYNSILDVKLSKGEIL